jgi:hypothetical protein
MQMQGLPFQPSPSRKRRLKGREDFRPLKRKAVDEEDCAEAEAVVHGSFDGRFTPAVPEGFDRPTSQSVDCPRGQKEFANGVDRAVVAPSKRRARFRLYLQRRRQQNWLAD